MLVRKTKRERRRKRRKPNRLPLRWLRVTAAVILVGLLGGAGVWWLREKFRGNSHLGSGGPAARPLPTNDPLLVTLPDFEKSLALAQRLVNATNVAEILPLIRNGEAMRSVVMADLAAHPPDPGSSLRLRQMSAVVEGTMAYQVFGLIAKSGRKCLVPVVPTPTGPRVDYKAYCEWCSVPASKLLDGGATEAAELRVLLRPSTYYNFGFADQDHWTAFDAKAPGARETMAVYVARGGEIDQRLRAALSRERIQPVTVALQAVDGSERHGQFLVTRLLALGFVVPDEAPAPQNP